MNKRSIGGLLAAAAVVSIGAVSTAQAAPAEKVDVCHVDGQGNYNIINISENAYQQHLDHGDQDVNEDGSCGALPGPTVTPGYSGLTEAGAVRFRAVNSGGEVYLGTPDLGVGGNRVETNISTWSATNPVTFSFDGTDLTTTVGGQTLTRAATGVAGCDPSLWDTVNIKVLDRDGVADSLDFNSVVVNGFPIGDFDGAPFGATEGPDWTVSGLDLSEGFDISGDIVVDGTWAGSAELDRVELTVGCTV